LRGEGVRHTVEWQVWPIPEARRYPLRRCPFRGDAPPSTLLHPSHCSILHAALSYTLLHPLIHTAPSSTLLHPPHCSTLHTTPSTYPHCPILHAAPSSTLLHPPHCSILHTAPSSTLLHHPHCSILHTAPPSTLLILHTAASIHLWQCPDRFQSLRRGIQTATVPSLTATKVVKAVRKVFLHRCIFKITKKSF
jgi:hypothetical protein